MRAAATAAGYLYASGRLRGRGGRDGVEQAPEHPPVHGEERRKPPRVAVLPQEEAPRADKPKRMPKIEYRRRRLPHG